MDLDGAGRKLAAHGAQFGHLVDSYVNSVNTCFKHMGVSLLENNLLRGHIYIILF